MGFKVDGWDFITFASLFLLVVLFLAMLVFALGLPGRIAIARKHPEAEAVNLMGWLGFLAVIPWIQAFMWAFKSTSVVDIRYLPEEEQQNIREMLAKLKGEETAQTPEATKPASSRKDQSGT
jgi:hypothetical protein